MQSSMLRKSYLERCAIEGDSPVFVSRGDCVVSRVLGVEIPPGNRESATSNSKYYLRPIVK